MTGTQLEAYIKQLFQTLDKQFNPTMNTSVETYKLEIMPQLKESSPILLNGNPIGGRSAFQQYWINVPLTQHSVTSLDYHKVPGTTILIINLSGKVRFNENGKTRLGESSETVQPMETTQRNIWGSWFGFNSNIILNENFLSQQTDVINSFNWNIVYQPNDSLIDI